MTARRLTKSTPVQPLWVDCRPTRVAADRRPIPEALGRRICPKVTGRLRCLCAGRRGEAPQRIGATRRAEGQLEASDRHRDRLAANAACWRALPLGQHLRLDSVNLVQRLQQCLDDGKSQGLRDHRSLQRGAVYAPLQTAEPAQTLKEDAKVAAPLRPKIFRWQWFSRRAGSTHGIRR